MNVLFKRCRINIKNNNMDKYVKQNSDGTISYVSKEEATEFITDEKGEILIENLIVGTYTAYKKKIQTMDMNL